MHVFLVTSTYLEQEAAIRSRCIFWENEFSPLSRNPMGSREAGKPYFFLGKSSSALPFAGKASGETSFPKSE